MGKVDLAWHPSEVGGEMSSSVDRPVNSFGKISSAHRCCNVNLYVSVKVQPYLEKEKKKNEVCHGTEILKTNIMLPVTRPDRLFVAIMIWE